MSAPLELSSFNDTCRPLAWKIAAINDTLADLKYEVVKNSDTNEDGSVRGPAEKYTKRRDFELTYDELDRALELETLRDAHYARLADALLEG